VDVAAWLRELGLERYEEAFQENEIDAQILPKLTADDLKDVGVTTVGHRRKLLEAIAALAEPTSAPRAEPSAPAEAAPRARPSEAERRQLTVLFCDIVGSTALSARLDPEDMGAVMSAYHRATAKVIESFGGHVARYLGDGVLAYFGWPLAHEDDGERAVRAGLELVEAMAQLQLHPDVRLQARVGIATGQVVVGDLVGEGAARDEAVVGETPNLAARLQALAAPGRVVISHATRRLVGGLFALADLGPRRVKGFAAPLAVWRVEGVGRAEGRFEALHGEHLTPLVGREHEIALLLDRWEQAKEGEGQVVLMGGEPGIGKSRIIRELRARLDREPCTVLAHNCSPYHVNTALYPLIDRLERQAGLDRADPPARQLDKLESLIAATFKDAQEVAPLLADLLSIPLDGRYPPLALTPARQKELTLRALVEQLVGLAARQPVLMLFEDAHWSDATSRELLESFIDQVRTIPALLVISFRPEFIPPWGREAHVAELPLQRLSRRRGAALAQEVAGGRAMPPEILDQIVAKTDGIPLFVEELTKTLLESGLLRPENNHFVLTGPLPPLAIPATLHDSLMARLDRLAPVKEVAQIGAAIGRDFSYDLLAAVAPLPEEQLLQALRQLVAAELIFARGTPPQATYSFKHALVQEAAHGSLLRGRRQQLHARIAGVLEQRFPALPESQPELLAHHYTEACFTEPAIDYWRKAGQRASARSAPTEAVGHLTKGLELLLSLPATPERHRQELDLQTALGGALIAAKGYSAPETGAAFARARELCGPGSWFPDLRPAGAAFARARELCAQIDDPAQLFPVLFGQWLFHQLRAELAVTREVADEMLRLAQEHADSAGLVIAHRATGTSLFWLGRFGEARTHLEQALALYDPERHAELAYLYNFDPRVIGLDFLSLTLFALGYPEQAQRRSEEALALAKQLSHLVTLAVVLQHACMIHQFLGEHGAVRQGAEELWSLATGQGLPFWVAHATFVRAWAEAQEGQSEEELVQLRRNLEVIRSSGAVLIVPYYLGLLAETYGRRGDLPAALDLLAEALGLVEQTGECWFAAELHRLRGELLWAAGDQDAAEAALRMAVALAREQDAKSWELRAASSLGRLCHARGRPAEARALLAPLCDWFTEGFENRDLKDAKALLDELG
jgi:class 3 adenylate cyclase/predicted ATPase